MSKEVCMCDDGVYRWSITRSMYRHPDSLPTILKAMVATMFVVWLILASVALCSADWEFLWGMTKMIFGIITPLFLVLSLFGYLIVAMIHGGKYHVVFEMDDNMIVHRQINHSTKDSELVGWLSVIAGTAMLVGGMSGGSSIAINGIRANSKMVMKVRYKDVTRIQVLTSKHTIRLYVKKWKYDIWTTPENISFVKDYLVGHCKKAEILM